MARSTPSLLALLGLAAVAGYQNRDKLGTMLGGQHARTTDPLAPQTAGGLRSVFSDLRSMFDKGGAGGGIAGGLNELMEQFRTDGQGQAADSCGIGKPQSTHSRD